MNIKYCKNKQLFPCCISRRACLVNINLVLFSGGAEKTWIAFIILDVGHQSQLFNGIPHYQPVLCTAQAHSIKMKRVKENCERKTPPTQTALNDLSKSQYSQSIVLMGDKSNKQSGGRILCGKIKIFFINLHS